MVNLVLWRKLFRDLLERWGAILALVLIVAIGVGLFGSMAGVYRDLHGARRRYYGEYHLADFSVDLKRAPVHVLDEVAAMPNVRAVRGRVQLGVRIDLPDVDLPITGTAISMPEQPMPVLNGILLRRGTWFSGGHDKQVILDDAFAAAHHLEPGSRIRVLLLDKQHDLLVVGTALSPEFVYVIPPAGGFAPDPSRYGILYLPERFLQESSDLDGAYNQLVGLAHDPSRTALDNTLRLIEERLDPYGVANSTPVHEQASAKYLDNEIQQLRVNIIIMPALFLGVAALVLNVLMGRLVAQQRTIIGTLKALGYSASAITRHYLAFGVVVGGIGGLAGVALGWWLQLVFIDMYRTMFALPNIAAHLYADIFAGGVGISVVCAMLGTLKGVRHASRLTPAEAMRPPPPEKGGKVLPERIGWLWRPLPFRWKMVLRAVFRNPFRSATTIIASFIATALVAGTLSSLDAVDFMMHYEFVLTSHQDVTISLRDPHGEQALPEVGDLPTVSMTEPQLGIACDLSNGPLRKRVGLTGLARGNRLYTPLDAAGRPVIVPDEGLVLTAKLAEILGVGHGDRVRLRPLIGQRQEVEAVVVGTVDSYMGLSGYADIAYLSRLLGESWVANSALGSSYAGASEAPFYRALRERPTVVGIGERTRALTQVEDTFGEMMRKSIAITVLFAGLIAFGSVLNATLVSLSERRREVGTLRVLGYTPLQISEIFSGESLVTNTVGILLGIAGGVGLIHLLALAYDTELFRFPVVILPSTLAISAVLVGVFVVIAQVIIYWMIRRLPWLEVMKIKE